MNEIKFFKFAWQKARIEYQKRYYAHLKSLEEKENNGSNKASVEYSRGHLLEASYALISIFGLTDKEILEIERNGGFTNADLEADLDAVFQLVKCNGYSADDPTQGCD